MRAFRYVAGVLFLGAILGCGEGVPQFTDSFSNPASEQNPFTGGVNSGAGVMTGSQFKIFGVTGLTIDPNTMSGSQFKIDVRRNN